MNTLRTISNEHFFSRISEWKELTPQELLSEFGGIVFEINSKVSKIATRNPDLPAFKQYIKKNYAGNLEVYLLSEEQYYHALRSGILDLRQEIKSLTESDVPNDFKIPKLVTLLVQYAMKESASDIHLEPRRYDSVVRFRLDGVLREVTTFSSEMHMPVIARIKILSNMRTDETRRPQDGRFEPEGTSGVSLRVSIMPTLYGEKVVMRILHESQGIHDLDQLGFTEEQQSIIKRNMEKPYGMIIASGPTGSGKTTTLYSFMRLLHAKDINIATLEDPVESSLEGVNQTQVNPDLNFSFAVGLRTLLRQDPDVILVGEIRDEETVTMAAHASMTGHLVLTSMHTNDAPSAFTRFMEMGIDNFLTASVVNLVVAQRLVRGLCEYCVGERPLDSVIVQKIRERRDVCDALKNVDKKLLNTLDTRPYKRSAGCEKCLHSGYSGRIGIFELLEMNKKIHDLVLASASADILSETAVKNGMRTMVQDGVEKVLSGGTTFEEILRVTRSS